MKLKLPPTITEADVPAESRLLREAYERSGVTVAELAETTKLSTGTITISLNGFRYRSDGPRVAVPSDNALSLLAGVLGVSPISLRAAGRTRAASMLEEAIAAGEQPTVRERPPSESEQEAIAALAARQALAIKVLAAFSTDELKAEVDRREKAEAEAG